MIDIPVFYDWLNEITDEIYQKADSLNISCWEAAGLRDDAPDHIKDAFKKYIKDQAYWRHNSTSAKPL